MHMPLYADTEMGRGGAPAVNVVHPEKSRRIDAMDEIKRALETAEEIPLRYLILHLGEREDRWSPRTLEHAMTAIEHLRAFARPLGVKLLLENIQSEVTEPRNLVEIVRDRALQRHRRMPRHGPCAHRRRRCRGHRGVEAAHSLRPTSMTTMGRKTSTCGRATERSTGRRRCRNCARPRRCPPRCWRSITCPKSRRRTIASRAAETFENARKL